MLTSISFFFFFIIIIITTKVDISLVFVYSDWSDRAFTSINFINDVMLLVTY